MGQTLLRGPQGTAGPSCPASGGLPGPLLGHRLLSQDPLPRGRLCLSREPPGWGSLGMPVPLARDSLCISDSSALQVAL